MQRLKTNTVKKLAKQLRKNLGKSKPKHLHHHCFFLLAFSYKTNKSKKTERRVTFQDKAVTLQSSLHLSTYFHDPIQPEGKATISSPVCFTFISS
mmetsp:Transcript_7653/g.18899  ORF Transcript_7653/g.18899 Transcript_7653/m.18899 type:complete len:95 (+) Transcript_7653:156-440(+)